MTLDSVDRLVALGDDSRAIPRRDRPLTVVLNVAVLISMLVTFAGCDSNGSAAEGPPKNKQAASSPPPKSMADSPPAEDLRVRQRSMRRAGGVLDLTFDDLEFDIEPDEDFEREMLTDKIESFDGKEVILRGFIFDGSIFSRSGIKQFVLVRDNQICCFGPGAKIHHNTMVEMEPGKSTDFSIRPVQVEGKFSIRPWINPGDGKTYSVFHILAHTVR